LAYTKGVSKGINLQGPGGLPSSLSFTDREIIMEHSGALFDMPSNEIKNQTILKKRSPYESVCYPAIV
jgi:hypothetical protein